MRFLHSLRMRYLKLMRRNSLLQTPWGRSGVQKSGCWSVAQDNMHVQVRMRYLWYRYSRPLRNFMVEMRWFLNQYTVPKLMSFFDSSSLAVSRQRFSLSYCTVRSIDKVLLRQQSISFDQFDVALGNISVQRKKWLYDNRPTGWLAWHSNKDWVSPVALALIRPRYGHQIFDQSIKFDQCKDEVIVEADCECGGQNQI